MDAGEIIARARALVGVRFRPQGREPATGLDCVGLVVAVFGLAGVRDDYRLRWADPAALEAGLSQSGFAAVAEPRAGDVLIVRAGAGQLHVVVLVRGGFVHADAGLRRVVEVPGAVEWPVVGAWRFAKKGDG